MRNTSCKNIRIAIKNYVNKALNVKLIIPLHADLCNDSSGGGGQTIIILPHLCVPKVHVKNFALKISRNIIRRFCKIIAFRLSFHTYKKQIVEWINSDEFRESYINKHHPYPPLLNPKTLDYKQIPAQLAWQLNIPLQEDYRFIFLSLHGCGGHAMQTFFRQCDIAINTRFNTDKDDYMILYDYLNSNDKHNYIAIWIRGYDFENDKFYHLLTRKVPILCVVRDPISLLKPFINHLGKNGYSGISPITLDMPYHEIILPPDYMFFQSSKDMSVAKLNEVLSYVDKREYFLAQKIHLLEKNIESFHYIPFKDIGIEHGFETFCALAEKFDFKPPKDKTPFQTKLNGSNSCWLFPVCVICSRTPHIELHIILHTDMRLKDSHYKDITDMILDKEPTLDYKIAILIKQDELQLLQNDNTLLQHASNYIKGYMIYLQELEKREKARHIKEDDMLEYFKNNKEACMYFQSILEREYAHLKEHRPDIIATWQYYNEFMKICECYKE